MLISSIYGMSRAIYKIGERKGMSKAEIQKIEKARTKKKKVSKRKSKKAKNKF
jgi:hypothetical protein